MNQAPRLTEAEAIAVDASGSAYVTGIAFSDGTFPVTSTTICNPAVSQFACDYAFVTKFDPTGSTLAYSTFLGPNNNAIPRAIALDSNDDAYVLSSTSSNSFGIVNGIETYSNGSDLLLVEIDPLASTQLFATYLGGKCGRVCRWHRSRFQRQHLYCRLNGLDRPSDDPRIIPKCAGRRD